MGEEKEKEQSSHRINMKCVNIGDFRFLFKNRFANHPQGEGNRGKYPGQMDYLDHVFRGILPLRTRAVSTADCPRLNGSFSNRDDIDLLP